MKKVFIIIAVFMLGFVGRDLSNMFVSNAKADTTGIESYDWKSDDNFKKAVKEIVENCIAVRKGAIACD